MNPLWKLKANVIIMDKFKKILIVEDEVAFLKSLAGELKFQRVKIFTATDGKSGLDLALKEHPDLIFLDIMLPVMDGITVLKELRKDSWGKNVIIILLTQVDDMNKVAEAMKNDVFKYFIKADHSIPDIIEQTKKYLSSLDTPTVK